MITEAKIVPMTEERRTDLRRRVLEARLRHLEQEAEILVADYALVERLGLPDAAEAIDARLVEMAREALRHRLALEQGVLEPMALVG